MNAALRTNFKAKAFTKTNHLDDIVLVWILKIGLMFLVMMISKTVFLIWYPVVDDIVTDMKYDFIFFIRHDGVIFDI